MGHDGGHLNMTKRMVPMIVFLTLFGFHSVSSIALAAEFKPKVEKSKDNWVVRGDDWEMESWVKYSATLKLAKQIEKVKRSLTEFFHVRLEVSRILRVIVLKDEAAFLAYSKNKLGEIFYMQGYYSRDQHEVVLWLHGHMKIALFTLSHELTHAYLNPSRPVPWIWVNEGICDYIAAGSVEGGKFEIRVLNSAYLGKIVDAEKNKTLIALDDLVKDKVYREGHQQDLQYAESWYLVYFLMEGEWGKYQEPFLKYLRDSEKDEGLSILSYVNMGEIGRLWLKKLDRLYAKSRKTMRELDE